MDLELSADSNQPSTIENQEAAHAAVPGHTGEAAPVGGRYLAKRLIDLVVADLVLMVFTPVILIIGCLLRMESRGPILFKTLRRGYGGRPFGTIKFRTKFIDAERHLSAIGDSKEAAGGVTFKGCQDPRLTVMGRFLRRYGLDKLPQLINVLRGEMSLVGPRPLRLPESDWLFELDPMAHARRLEVMPGLTGPWQIGGRTDADYKRMIELELDYVANWTIPGDILLLARTLWFVLFQKHDRLSVKASKMRSQAEINGLDREL